MQSRQFLAFRFGPEASFEGQLVGALERVESGGAVKVLDAFFLRRESETGELTAVSLRGGSAGGMVAQLLGFRLDEGERASATRRALEGAGADAVQQLATTLAPGEAIAAVLVEHAWAETLADAVARLGGTETAAAFVEQDDIAELIQALLTAPRPPRPDPAAPA
jgi:hypothetical protein